MSEGYEFTSGTCAGDVIMAAAGRWSAMIELGDLPGADQDLRQAEGYLTEWHGLRAGGLRPLVQSVLRDGVDLSGRESIAELTNE